MRGVVINGRPGLLLDLNDPDAARLCAERTRRGREDLGPAELTRRVEEAIRAVDALGGVEWREGGQACVVLARQKLLRLRDLLPRGSARTAEPETRCERGCYVD